MPVFVKFYACFVPNILTQFNAQKTAVDPARTAVVFRLTAVHFSGTRVHVLLTGVNPEPSPVLKFYTAVKNFTTRVNWK